MSLSKKELGEVLAIREVSVYDWRSIVAATIIGLQRMMDFMVRDGHDAVETYAITSQLDTAISMGHRVLKATISDEELARDFFLYVAKHFDRWWD